MTHKKFSKFQILLLAEFFFLFLLLIGCFRQEKPVIQFSGEEIAAAAHYTESGLVFESTPMKLSPGVYRVNIETDPAKGQDLFVELSCHSSYFNTLRGNEVTVYSGDRHMDFLVYATDTIPTAFLRCSFTGADTDSLLQLELFRTAKDCQILLVSVFALFLIVDFLVLWRRKILAGEVSPKQQVVFWVLTGAVLLSYFPYLTDYFSYGDDLFFHLERIANLKNSLLDANAFPIRIQGTWLYDHGYATSLFYSDVFLLFPSLLCLLGFPIMTSYKLFVLAVLAATVVISYFSIKKCVQNEWAALIGSLIYLLSPYHLFNIYNRAAVGEYLAMTFFPLICCGLYLLYTGDVTSKEYKRAKWYLILGMSATLQCHLLSTEMTILLMAVFCLVCFKRTFRKETLLQLGESTGLVLLLNAWFWVPMLYMMGCDNYRLTTTLPTGFWSAASTQFSSLFLFFSKSGLTPNGQFYYDPLHIGVGALLLLFFYLVWRYGTGQKNRNCDIFALFTLLSLLLSSEYLPWEDLTEIPLLGYLLSSLQFPFRWLSWGSMFAAFLVACIAGAGKEASKAWNSWRRGAILLGTIITVISAVFYTNSIAYVASPLYLYTVENFGTTTVGNGEYLPAETTVSDLYYHGPVAEDGLSWSDFEQRGTDISLSLTNTTEETLHVELPLLGYKGYAIETSQEHNQPYITPERGTHGDLRIAVPPDFSGELQVSYRGFPLFRVSEVISLVTIAAVPELCLLRKRKASAYVE